MMNLVCAKNSPGFCDGALGSFLGCRLGLWRLFAENHGRDQGHPGCSLATGGQCNGDARRLLKRTNAALRDKRLSSRGIRDANRYFLTWEKTLSAENDREVRTGAMHASDKRIQEGGYGVKTLLHEARHEYAGTMGYCYFSDDSVTPRSAFDGKAKPLVNADSVAWFVVKVGRTIFGGAHKNKIHRG